MQHCRLDQFRKIQNWSNLSDGELFSNFDTFYWSFAKFTDLGTERSRCGKNSRIRFVRNIAKPFNENDDPWKNQAIQREYLLKCTDFLDEEDYIFFSDPDEIPDPNLLVNFSLKKKYGIFFQKCFYN